LRSGISLALTGTERGEESNELETIVALDLRGSKDHFLEGDRE
jgi:hypothetical protein